MRFKITHIEILKKEPYLLQYYNKNMQVNNYGNSHSPRSRVQQDMQAKTKNFLSGWHHNSAKNWKLVINSNKIPCRKLTSHFTCPFSSCLLIIWFLRIHLAGKIFGQLGHLTGTGLGPFFDGVMAVNILLWTVIIKYLD